jgi:peptidoglycan/xylan/chitin deacetylase (PgdA/CDA1 family)
MTGPLGSRLEGAVELLKACPNDEIEKAITELSVIWGMSPNPTGRAFVSWNEAREMARTGLITFGSHTASHSILSMLEDSEIRQELVESRKRLIAEQVVDPTFIPFCYPNGNHNNRIVSMVRNTGYNLAVTTKNGSNNPGSDPFTLRRIAIHQDMTSTEAMFGCKIVGIL